MYKHRSQDSPGAADIPPVSFLHHHPPPWLNQALPTTDRNITTATQPKLSPSSHQRREIPAQEPKSQRGYYQARTVGGNSDDG